MRRLSFLAVGSPDSNGTLLRASNGHSPEAVDDTTNGAADGERPNALVANARREFSSAFGDLARGKRNWQLIELDPI